MNKDAGKKFALSFLSIVIFMGLYALLALPLKIAEGQLEENTFIILLVLYGLGAFVFFYLWLFFSIRKIWFFKGEGDPLPYEQLKKELFSINDFDVPVMVEERKNKIVVTWRYVDSKWWEFLAKAGLKKVYELHIRLKPEKHEAILTDVLKKVEWRAGLTKFKWSLNYFRGVSVNYELGKQWGIKENFKLGKVYDYKFTQGEIRNPVMNTLLKKGWNIRFSM